MTPTTFPQANTVIKPPDDIPESQITPIAAFLGIMAGGCFDGAQMVTVAWQPSPEERERINQGASIFITFLGGVLAHSVSTEFPE